MLSLLQKARGIKKMIASIKKSKGFVVMLLCFVLVIGIGGKGVYAASKDAKKEIVKENVGPCDIKIDLKNTNVVIIPTKENKITYSYDSNLWKIEEKSDKNLQTIRVDKITKQKLNMEECNVNKIFIYIPNFDKKKLQIESEHSGLVILPTLSDLSINSTKSAVNVLVNKGFTNNIDLKMAGGSGALNFQEGATHYILDVQLDKSVMSVTEELPSFNQTSKYKIKKGFGKNDIHIKMSDSAYAINMYSGEAIKQLENNMTIVTQ